MRRPAAAAAAAAAAVVAGDCRTASSIATACTPLRPNSVYLQHTSQNHIASRLGSSHWDPYAMHTAGCLELYYCNMVEWSWWDSGLIGKTNWFPSVL